MVAEVVWDKQDGEAIKGAEARDVVGRIVWKMAGEWFGQSRCCLQLRVKQVVARSLVVEGRRSARRLGKA